MKVSLKWLGEYVDLKLAPREVAEKLTMAGIEVKAVTAVGGWENVVVGEVLG